MPPSTKQRKHLAKLARSKKGEESEDSDSELSDEGGGADAADVEASDEASDKSSDEEDDLITYNPNPNPNPNPKAVKLYSSHRCIPSDVLTLYPSL